MELLNELITNDNKNLIIKELNDNKYELLILLNQIKDDIQELKNDIREFKEFKNKYIFLFVLSGFIFSKFI